MQRRMTGTSEAARLRLAAVAAEYLERMGQRIRERREELGLSRADVARAMPGKTNENAIYRWEKGAHRPQDDALEALAGVLGVEDWTYFIATEPDKSATPDMFQPAFPIEALEGALAEVLAEIKAQLAEQTQVLDEIKDTATRVETMLEEQRELKAEADEVVQTIRRAQREFADGHTPEDAPSPQPVPAPRAAARKKRAAKSRTP